MVILIPNTHVKGRAAVPLGVSRPEKIERLLRAGWSLGEGESFERIALPEDVKKPPVATNVASGDVPTANDNFEGDVSLDDIPDGDGEGDDGESGDDGEEPASTHPAPAPAPVAAGSLPGLSGKSRDALAKIADNEGVQYAADATKPDIKRAIEAHRAAN